MKKLLATLAVAGLAGGFTAGTALAGHEDTCANDHGTGAAGVDSDQASYIVAEDGNGNYLEVSGDPTSGPPPAGSIDGSVAGQSGCSADVPTP
jgi:hypothetical protein